MPAQDLRLIVERRLNQSWSAFAAAHPALAAAIDRTELADHLVEQLRGDPVFAAALRQADMDEARLAAAADLLDCAQRVLSRFLPP